MIFPYKGLVIFVVSVIILIGSIVYALEQVSELKKGLKWTNKTNEIVNDLDLLVLNTSESESFWLGYLLTEDNQFIQKYNGTVKYVNSELVTIIHALPDNRKQSRRFKEISILITEKIGIQNAALELKIKGKLTTTEMQTKFNLVRL
jgi:CHASE3 domain sensor protein